MNGPSLDADAETADRPVPIAGKRDRVRAAAGDPAASGTHGRFLLLLWCALAGICAVVLFCDAIQPGGMLFPPYILSIDALRRLVPLGLLTGCALGFSLRAAAGDVVAATAGLPGLIVRRWRVAAWLSIGAALAGTLAVVAALRAFPNSGDEYAYLFEAETFLAGRLWNPAPPLPDLFGQYYLLVAHGRWAALYPPGWPLLLAAVTSLKLPSWLACPLAGALLLFFSMKLGRLRDGPLGGLLAVALIAVSPFFVFNAASYFDMVPAAAAGLMFCWAALTFLDRPRLANGAAAGLALGLLGSIRSQDVLLFALPFAVEFLLRARRRHFRLAPVVMLAGLPFLAGLLVYYHTVFGSPLQPTSPRFPDVRFGLFAVDEWGDRLTPLDELRSIAVRIVMLAEWTSPLLVIGYVAAFGWLAARRRLRFPDFIFPVYVLGFMLVPVTGGNQYGPRYYFEGLPFLALTVVSALVPLLREVGQPRRRAFLVSLVAAHGAICLAATGIFAVMMHVMVDQRMDVYDRVRAKNLHDAVVVLRSGTGVLRPMNPLDLTRNGIAADKSVLYVLDIPDQIEKLRHLLSDRRFYVYERAPSRAEGVLRRL